MRGGLRDCRLGDRGGAAVEFALVAPILLALVFGIIQFGMVMFVQNNMMNAAREAARQHAVGAVTLAGAQTVAQNYLANWGMTFTVTATNPTATEVSVLITVPIKQASMIDVLGLFGSGNLEAKVVMRKEG